MKKVFMILLILLVLCSCQDNKQPEDSKGLTIQTETAMETITQDNMLNDTVPLFIRDYYELNKIKGHITIDDILFINKNSTHKDIYNEIGRPDAYMGIYGNSQDLIYKLADGGILKIRAHGSGEEFYAYIVYKDVIIVIYIPEDDYTESENYNYVVSLEGIKNVKYLKDLGY